jgi:hypothetical protein
MKYLFKFPILSEFLIKNKNEIHGDLFLKIVKLEA